MTPNGEWSCDGVSLDPLEVMFVKVKSYMLTSAWSFSKKAVKYQAWQNEVSKRNEHMIAACRQLAAASRQMAAACTRGLLMNSLCEWHSRTGGTRCVGVNNMLIQWNWMMHFLPRACMLLQHSRYHQPKASGE